MKKQNPRVPLKVSDNIIGKCAVALKEGNWIIAELINGKYHYSIAPTQYESLEKCQEACDIINKQNGFTKEQIHELLTAK